MIWNNHKQLEGLHAFLGASQFRWINWTDDKLVERFYSDYATQIGTLIHEVASNCIKHKVKLKETDLILIEYTLRTHYIPKEAYDSEGILINLMSFVNDAIDNNMSTEVILYWSPVCFGTTDAILYDDKKKILRIHDLKTGSTPAHMEQLYIYAALFCLEYHVEPKSLKKIILSLYQSGEVLVEDTDADVIIGFMQLIKERSTAVLNLREGIN